VIFNIGHFKNEFLELHDPFLFRRTVVAAVEAEKNRASVAAKLTFSAAQI